jgi:glycosyltransferase involved in cell wall biosynthesis
VLYVQGMLDPALEARVLQVAPAVFFAHGYLGTCISGAKAWKRPQVRPCDRCFGWRCLLHYSPRRCGGLNPLTMAKLYRRNATRLELLRRYRLIVTHSAHLCAEYTKHGLQPYRVPYPVRSFPGPIARSAEPAWRLLFVGRMDFLKGGRTLLDALPRAQAVLDRPLRVTFAGDGPERGDWERYAARLGADFPEVRIAFTGWVDGVRLAEQLDSADLLVVPSLWPEPFGMVGPEAGNRGVPSAAFAVGGIVDWLTDGVNGHLAPGDPPTAAGLADAIVECLRDLDHYAQLRRGAVEQAQQFTMPRHLRALCDLLERAVA